MRLRFAGAATTVTGAQFLLETERARLLVDCGMFQGPPNEVARNRLPFLFEPTELDTILLTHAHLDHCGMVPAVVAAGFRGPIVGTAGTARLGALVMLDSAKIQVEDAKRAKRRRERDERRAHARPQETEPAGTSAEAVAVELASDTATAPSTHPAPVRSAAVPPGVDAEADLRGQPPVIDTREMPLYLVEDAEQAVRQFRSVDYDQTIEVAPGVQATFQDAGHILGSAVILLDVEERGETRRIVFSGDLGRPDTPIIRDPTPITGGADYLLVESTYGGREHDPMDEAIRGLADTVRAVADLAGVLMIPAFSIGRTQEIVWYLDRLLEQGAIPRVPLYLDSPMASHATDVYRDLDGYYDEETARLVRQGASPLDYPDEHITRTAEESKAIRTAPRPLMVVAASGMLSGGRIVHHLKDYLGDERAILLFVGYQGEGTMGRHIQDGTRTVRIEGQEYEVRCQVRSISGFSAHADESELLDWLRHFAEAPRRPRRVFLVHGDPEATEALAPRVRELGLEPYLPTWREVVELT